MAAMLNATVPLGLHVPTGSCSTVGVAGFVSGGGIGWTSRLYGLAADNVVGARVMLANGTTVSAQKGGPHSDLLWAVSGGGGGNFGVVLDFTLALHPMPRQLLYAEFAYPWDAAANATQAYFSLWADPRFLFYCLFVRPSSDPQPSVLLQGIWLGDLGEGQAALAPLTALAAAANASGDASASVIVTDYMTAHALFEGPLGARTANKQKSAFVPATGSTDSSGVRSVPAVISAGALEVVRAALVAAPPDVADNSAVYLNSMGGQINALAVDATPFPHRDALANWVIDCHWVRNETTPAALAWTRGLYASMASNGYLGPPPTAAAPLPTYANYQDSELTEEQWPLAYYGPNYAGLQRVKAAYDPNNGFTFQQAVQLPNGQE